MLAHAAVGSRDIPAARAFYAKVLAPLGLRIVDEMEGRFVDFGTGGPQAPVFSVERPGGGRPAAPGHGTRIAFQAPNARTVVAFYVAALASGGRSDSLPGPRPAHGPGYFSAYAYDPDGNRIEAVWREPPETFTAPLLPATTGLDAATSDRAAAS